MTPINEPGEIEPRDLSKLAKLAPDDALLLASNEYRKLKSRDEHPGGLFDKAGRFTLSPRLACCQGIRTPSRNFPYSEMAHARSALHVAHANGLASRQIDIVQFSRLLDKYPMLATGIIVSKAAIAAAAAQAALKEIARAPRRKPKPQKDAPEGVLESYLGLPAELPRAGCTPRQTWSRRLLSSASST